MKTKWLFPHRYRLIGWLIFIPSLVHGLPFILKGDAYDSVVAKSIKNITDRLSVYHYEFTDEVVSVGIIVGLLLIAFSREKVEDEMIGRLRLEALQWSVYANYIILVIAILTVYDTAFFSVMIYNMFTVLLVFIGRFRWLLHRSTNLLLV